MYLVYGLRNLNVKKTTNWNNGGLIAEWSVFCSFILASKRAETLKRFHNAVSIQLLQGFMRYDSKKKDGIHVTVTIMYISKLDA